MALNTPCCAAAENARLSSELEEARAALEVQHSVLQQQLQHMLASKSAQLQALQDALAAQQRYSSHAGQERLHVMQHEVGMCTVAGCGWGRGINRLLHLVTGDLILSLCFWPAACREHEDELARLRADAAGDRRDLSSLAEQLAASQAYAHQQEQELARYKVSTAAQGEALWCQQE